MKTRTSFEPRLKSSLQPKVWVHCHNDMSLGQWHLKEFMRRRLKPYTRSIIGCECIFYLLQSFYCRIVLSHFNQEIIKFIDKSYNTSKFPENRTTEQLLAYLKPKIDAKVWKIDNTQKSLQYCLKLKDLKFVQSLENTTKSKID